MRAGRSSFAYDSAQALSVPYGPELGGGPRQGLPTTKQTGPPTALGHLLLYSGGLGFVIRGHNLANHSDLGWFLLGHNPLPSSGVLRWIVEGAGVKEPF